MAEYKLSPKQAQSLLDLIEGKNAQDSFSKEELFILLKEVLNLSQSLNDNCREWLELAAICHGDMHFYTAEKLNIPTLKGALSAAVKIPRVEQCNKMCSTCAFRCGTSPNQTSAVAEDIADALEDNDDFWCHDFEGSKPTKLCRGFLKARKQIKNNQH